MKIIQINKSKILKQLKKKRIIIPMIALLITGVYLITQKSPRPVVERAIFDKLRGISMMYKKQVEFVEYQNPNLLARITEPTYTFVILSEDNVIGGLVAKLKNNYLLGYTIESEKNLYPFTLQNSQYSYEQVVEIAKNSDITKNEKGLFQVDTAEIDAKPKTQEYQDFHNNSYFNKIRKNSERVKGRKVLDYTKVKLNDPYWRGGLSDFALDRGEESPKFNGKNIAMDYKQNAVGEGTGELATLLEDPQFPKAKFIGLHYLGPTSPPPNATEATTCDTCEYGPKYYKDTKLKRITIVKFDRTVVEVPAKTDGMFDFESVIDRLKE
jgi:hypothetical protein